MAERSAKHFHEVSCLSHLSCFLCCPRFYSVWHVVGISMVICYPVEVECLLCFVYFHPWCPRHLCGAGEKHSFPLTHCLQCADNSEQPHSTNHSVHLNYNIIWLRNVWSQTAGVLWIVQHANTFNKTSHFRHQLRCHSFDFNRVLWVRFEVQSREPDWEVWGLEVSANLCISMS